LWRPRLCGQPRVHTHSLLSYSGNTVECPRVMLRYTLASETLLDARHCFNAHAGVAAGRRGVGASPPAPPPTPHPAVAPVVFFGFTSAPPRTITQVDVRDLASDTRRSKVAAHARSTQRRTDIVSYGARTRGACNRPLRFCVVVLTLHTHRVTSAVSSSNSACAAPSAQRARRAVASYAHTHTHTHRAHPYGKHAYRSML